MFSMNEWVLRGKVEKVSCNQKGYWIVVKGAAENPSVFTSDVCKMDCWISNRVLGNKSIKDDIFVVGRLKFKKNECFFVADRVA